MTPKKIWLGDSTDARALETVEYISIAIIPGSTLALSDSSW